MDLRTDRLRIRNFEMADADAALAYLGNPQVMAFIEPAMDRSAAESFIMSAGLAQPPLVFCVEDLGSSQVIGHVIFHPWVDGRSWELGWVLRRDRWGHSLAQELSCALIDYGFHTLELTRIIAESEPANLASIAVMERIGMTRAPELDIDLPVWKLDRASPSESSDNPDPECD